MPIRKKYRIKPKYPKNKYFFKRKLFSWRKLVKIVVVLAIGLFFLGSAAIVGLYLHFSRDLPSPDKIFQRLIIESTKIFDRTGQTLLYEIHGEEKRTIVKLDQISPYLRNAIVAIEDKDFYKHEGVDFRGIARAILINLWTKSLKQGGSTISQQLVKNSLLSRERTLTRKIKEWILAIEMERKYSKDQILEMYLNQIPFGSNAYGAEAASQTFFGKPAADLTLSEAALLASLPKAPTRYSPYGSRREELQARYKTVIEKMEDQNLISHDEAREAKEEDILAKVKPFRENIIAPHFVFYVKDLLAEDYGEDIIEQGGLKVYTTLDLEKQKIAEEAVLEGLDKYSKKYNVANAALVANDPKTGQILAMVGSKDYFGKSLPEGCASGKNCLFEPNDNVAIRERSPGSSFKPFVYATAFKKGYTTETILFDLDTEFNPECSPNHIPQKRGVKCYHPDNFDKKFRGPVTMRQALGMSLNVPSVKTFYLAGVQDSIELAHQMGITTLKNPADYGLALVLGGGGIKLFDEVAAYSVFANDGVKQEKRAILKIEKNNGEILADFSKPDEGERVLNENVARMISSILTDNVARTPVFGPKSDLYFSDRHVAAKTGTSDDYKDAWTIGYTPSIAVGVWAGNNDSTQMNRAGGIFAAAPIWRLFMNKVLAQIPVENFPIFEPIKTSKSILTGKIQNEVKIKLDKACGDKLASPDTPLEQIEEKKFLEIHNILYYVEKNNPQGPIPKNPADDPLFVNWEAPVLAWAQINGFTTSAEVPPSTFCPLRTGEYKPKIWILEPTNKQIYTFYSNPLTVLPIKANIFAALGVREVTFFFNNALIGTKTNSPWEIDFNIPSDIKDGTYTISARLIDQIGNSAEDKITIEIVLDNIPPQIELKAPNCSKDSCILSAWAHDTQTGIKTVEFYWRDTQSQTNTFNKIEGKVTKASDIYSISWQTSQMPAGDYEIYARTSDKRNNIAESERMSILIEKQEEE